MGKVFTEEQYAAMDKAQREALRGVANERQEGGTHYASTIQHWDYVAANNLGYFEGQITKYVSRWHKKNGLQDLEKAKHFLDKLIENVKTGQCGGSNAAA